MIQTQLKKFFDDEYSQVLLIKGHWGIGKTFIWEKFIEKYIQDKKTNYRAYSYVSLFGKVDINSVKNEIFDSSIVISKLTQDKELYNEKLKKQEVFDIYFKNNDWKYTLFSWLTFNKLVKYFDQKYSDKLYLMGYNLLKHHIVCLDDIERKSEAFSIKQLMGLADELANKKSCKVVIIFNENSLVSEAEKSQFKEYREKIVDIELEYKPSFQTNFNLVFTPEIVPNYYEFLEEITSKLNIKNIRVLKKIKSVLGQFWKYLDGKHEKVQQQFIHKVVIFCWSYYCVEDSISFDELNIWFSNSDWRAKYLFGGFSEDTDPPQNEKIYNFIREFNLEVNGYEQSLIETLMTGSTNYEVFNEQIDDAQKNVEYSIVRDQVREQRSKFESSLADNKDIFLMDLNTILSEKLSWLPLYEFDWIISMLDDFGNDIETKTIIDEYFYINKESLKQSAVKEIEARFSTQINTPEIMKRYKSLIPSNDELSLDQMLFKSVNGEMSPTSAYLINYLNTVSECELFNWIKSDPEDMVRKVRFGLLYYDGNDKYQSIADKTKMTLRKIAKESNYNQARVLSIFSIDIENY
jgi:hypothetical protein